MNYTVSFTIWGHEGNLSVFFFLSSELIANREGQKTILSPHTSSDVGAQGTPAHITGDNRDPSSTSSPLRPPRHVNLQNVPSPQLLHATSRRGALRTADRDESSSDAISCELRSGTDVSRELGSVSKGRGGISTRCAECLGDMFSTVNFSFGKRVNIFNRLKPKVEEGEGKLVVKATFFFVKLHPRAITYCHLGWSKETATQKTYL